MAEPDPLSGETLTTSYAYDWMDHVSQVTMARAGTTQTRTFVYNDAGLPISATNPENGTVYFYYNPDNTLLDKYDAKGQDTIYTYDSKKRVTMVQRFPTGHGNAEDTCQRVTYSYDTNPYSSGFSQYATGRLTATTYFAGNCPAGVGQSMTEMYSYHAAGAVTAKSLQAGTLVNMTVNYTYNSAGQLATSAYPSGGTSVAAYAYDAMGRLNSASVRGITGYAVQNAQYDVAGRMNSIQYVMGAANTQETMSYNVNGQLASLNWAAAPGSSGYTGPTGGIQYSYSATQNNGQVTQAVDTLSGETIGYQYDSLRRLTSAASTPIAGSTPAAWTQTFQYDGFGNLTAKALNGTTTPTAVNAATNRLLSANYDSNGNMTSGAGATLTYDVANRLASAAETSGGIEYYGYAPDNKRVFRQLANGHQQITLYGAWGEKLQMYDLTASAWGPSYIWFGGKLIYDGNFVYQDRVGTNRVSGARFMPYGDEITSTANDHVKFGTYARDSYTGLDYADQRLYAGTYGRFNTPDPYNASAGPSDPVSWNRYSYTGGDPVNRGDPTGNCWIDFSGNVIDPSGCTDEDLWGSNQWACLYLNSCPSCDPNVLAFAGSGDSGCNGGASTIPVETAAPPQLSSQGCPVIPVATDATMFADTSYALAAYGLSGDITDLRVSPGGTGVDYTITNFGEFKGVFTTGQYASCFYQDRIGYQLHKTDVGGRGPYLSWRGYTGPGYSIGSLQVVSSSGTNTGYADIDQYNTQDVVNTVRHLFGVVGGVVQKIVTTDPVTSTPPVSIEKRPR